MSKELSYQDARLICDPDIFHCNSTKDLEPMSGIMGQDRAVGALKFGLNIDNSGFNIYVSGMPGSGRTTAIKGFLEQLAAKRPVPGDWCYVYNFHDSYRPHAISLPAGKGKELEKDMQHAIDNASRRIPQAFSSKEYTEKRDEIAAELNRQKEESFQSLGEKAKEAGFIIQNTPAGLVFTVAPNGEPMTEEAFQQLPDEEKERLKKIHEDLNKLLQNEIRKLRTGEGAIQERMQNINQEVAQYAIHDLFDELEEKYKELTQVLQYLKEVQKDISENLEFFLPMPKQQELDPTSAMQVLARRQAMRKYSVNVLVDNSELKGAPVVVEYNPTFNSLFGRIEKEPQFGALYTDFTMLKGGSLHQANGGFLVLRILDLLTNFQSWEGLKRTLRAKQAIIEEISERLGFMAAKSLNPEPIPLDIKILLIGDPTIYYLLYQQDPEFKEFFKVKADFDTRIDRTEKNLRGYASAICRLCKEEKLLHLKSDALAKLIEFSSRLAADKEKISAVFSSVADIVREAHFWAKAENKKFITAPHVQKAIEQKIYRSNLIQQQVNEMIADGTIMIDVSGENVIGQVNGLAVLDAGDFSFGKPSRITASVGVGREGLVDIEREAKLGGPLHTKGVMILVGYLTGKYMQNIPMSLSARLVFEQSYGGVDGDSASSTEVYALLSRLAEVPLKQNIAVTGSVNQKGEVQAIGGVNQKIEGFFEVCRLKGLNGQQGVMIPQSNVRNLMLKEEVVNAIKEGKFHIYPVSTIDEGIEVLTGEKSGKLLANGNFKSGSINDRVQKRLQKLAEKLKEFGKNENGKNNSEKKQNDK